MPRRKKLIAGDDLDHEYISKFGRLNIATYNLRKTHPELHESVAPLCSEVGKFLKRNWKQVKAASNVGVADTGNVRVTRYFQGRIRRYYKRLEDAREAVWKAYNEEGLDPKTKSRLASIHHDLAASTNSIELLILRGSEEAAGAEDIRDILETTGRRKFRGVPMDIRVSRSVPRRGMSIDRGTMALLLDNLAENGEKASKGVGNDVRFRVSRRRNGNLQVRMRNRVDGFDEGVFHTQRVNYGKRGHSATFQPNSGSGIVRNIIDGLGGRARVSRRKAKDGNGGYYYFTAEIPCMA